MKLHRTVFPIAGCVIVPTLSCSMFLWIAFGLRSAESEDMVITRSMLAIPTPNLVEAATHPNNGQQLSQGSKVRAMRQTRDPEVPGITWTLVESPNGHSGWVQSNVLVGLEAATKPAGRLQATREGAEGGMAFLINNDGTGSRLVTNPNFQNTGSDVALLPVGTAVTGLNSQPDPALPFLEWHRIRVNDGPHKGKEGWVSVGVLESVEARPSAATHTIDNEGSAARVVPVPSIQAASNFADDVGTVALGTPVSVTATKTDPALGFFEWSRVEIHGGPHKGKSGWVSSNALRETPKKRTKNPFMNWHNICAL